MSVSATTLSRLVKVFLGGDSDDLDDLAVLEASIADRLDIGAGDVPMFAQDLGGETHGGIRFGISGFALAIESDLLGADLCQV
jgi:hypothetical protein